MEIIFFLDLTNIPPTFSLPMSPKLLRSRLQHGLASPPRLLNFFLPEGLSERVVGVGAAIKVVGLEQQHDWARRGGDHASGVTVACVTGMSMGRKGRDWLQG